MNTQAIRGDLPLRDGALRRTLWQSLITPVITTSLYFIVFGAAIGQRMAEVGGVSYGAFIVPGLIMLSLFTESLNNSSFGIYLPKFTGTIYELLSAPISPFEIVVAYVGAAATKSVLLGLVILATANLFVPVHIAHPVWMTLFLVLTATTFCLFGFVLGVWAKSFEQLSFIPMLVITPLTFVGGGLLLHRHASARMADLQPLQPDRLPDQRLSMDLPRCRRCRCGRELWCDAGALRCVRTCGGMDLPDRLPDQELRQPGAAFVAV